MLIGPHERWMRHIQVHGLTSNGDVPSYDQGRSDTNASLTERGFQPTLDRYTGRGEIQHDLRPRSIGGIGGTIVTRAYCKAGRHYPDILLSSPFGCEPGTGLTMHNDGTSDNHWWDGTLGVSDELIADAEAEETMHCYEQGCPGYLDEVDWEHGERS